MNRREPSSPSPEAWCVWMAAGLLAYRLCDRDFDCEHCPLDAAMRGTGRIRPAEPAASWRFPSDRRYHPRHFWVKLEPGDRARCGFDAFAARLLGTVVSLVLPARGSRLTAGRAALWLARAGGLLPLRAPVGGTVLRTNGEAQRDPTLLGRDPYGEGWLIQLEGSGEEAAVGLLSAEAMRERAGAQLERVRKRLARRLVPGAAEIGATAADGGEPWPDLAALLAPTEHKRLLQRFVG